MYRARTQPAATRAIEATRVVQTSYRLRPTVEHPDNVRIPYTSCLAPSIAFESGLLNRSGIFREN